MSTNNNKVVSSTLTPIQSKKQLNVMNNSTQSQNPQDKINMEKKPNECYTFLNPVPHTYKNVNTDEVLNIGIITAYKKAFELGVKYTKDIIITIGTAETTALIDASLITVEHFIDKLEEHPKIAKIIKSVGEQMPKIIGLLDSTVNIFRYIGYDYLTKSYNQYANTPNPYLDVDGNLTQYGLGFKKLIDLVSQLDNTGNHQQLFGSNDMNTKVHDKTYQTKPTNGKKMGGMNNKTYDALRIVDKMTDDILKLPRELQEDELIKIIDMLKNKMDMKQMGGKSTRNKTNKKCRNIRKMIKRSMRKFCKGYSHITK